MSIRIIACGVFRDALRYIELRRFHPTVAVTYIPPVLHNTPDKLKAEILLQIHTARKARDDILCLYGQCYPDLDPMLSRADIRRVPGAHCYEILLGSKSFRKLMDEEAGTYFLEKELVLNFAEYCVKPLELDDPVLRETYFKHYKRLAYVRQPLDPDFIVSRVQEIAHLLDLESLVIDADYSEFRTNLFQFLSV